MTEQERIAFLQMHMVLGAVRCNYEEMLDNCTIPSIMERLDGIITTINKAISAAEECMK